jgi:hypothetical protein
MLCMAYERCSVSPQGFLENVVQLPSWQREYRVSLAQVALGKWLEALLYEILGRGKGR